MPTLNGSHGIHSTVIPSCGDIFSHSYTYSQLALDFKAFFLKLLIGQFFQPTVLSGESEQLHLLHSACIN